MSTHQIRGVALSQIWLHPLRGLSIALLMIALPAISAEATAEKGGADAAKAQNSLSNRDHVGTHKRAVLAEFDLAIRAQEARKIARQVGVLSQEELHRLGIRNPPDVREPSNGRGLSPAQRQEASKACQEAFCQWAESLSVTQKADLENAAKAAEAAIEKQLEATEADGRGVVTEISESKMPDPAAGYSWKKDAQNQGLPTEAISRLDRDKVLIDDFQLEQSFAAYTGDGPFFITSDSILNGFHVLFEDSFRELEYRQAPRLRTCLEQILQHGRQAVKASTLPSVLKIA